MTDRPGNNRTYQTAEGPCERCGGPRDTGRQVPSNQYVIRDGERVKLCKPCYEIMRGPPKRKGGNYPKLKVKPSSPLYDGGDEDV